MHLCSYAPMLYPYTMNPILIWTLRILSVSNTSTDAMNNRLKWPSISLLRNNKIYRFLIFVLCFLILQVNQSRRDAVYDLIVFILRMMTMIMTMWQYLCMMMVPYYLLHCTHSIVCTIRWDGMLEDDHHFNWTPLPRQLSSCYLSDSASCTLCCCVWLWWSVLWYKWSEQIISEWLCDQWPCDDDKWPITTQCLIVDVITIPSDRWFDFPVIL